MDVNKKVKLFNYFESQQENKNLAIIFDDIQISTLIIDIVVLEPTENYTDATVVSKCIGYFQCLI